MLVLSRRNGEEIVVGDEVIIKVLATNGGRVRIGIEAPRQVPVRRGELPKSRHRANDKAQADFSDPMELLTAAH